MDASLRCAPFSMTCCVIPNAFSLSFQMFFPCYSEYFSLSFRTPVRNPARYGCFASLRSVQHDMLCHSECFFPVIPNVFFPVIPSTFFCHSKRQRGIQRDVDASLCSAWLGQGWQPLVPLLAKGEGRLPTADRVRLSSPLFQRQE
jgi:hypothetical protein